MLSVRPPADAPTSGAVWSAATTGKLFFRRSWGTSPRGEAGRRRRWTAAVWPASGDSRPAFVPTPEPERSSGLSSLARGGIVPVLHIGGGVVRIDLRPGVHHR